MSDKKLRVFVNYRRADEKIFVELLRTHFMFRYGQENVFMDFDSLPPFTNFEEFIRQTVRESDVIAMMIGKHWTELRKAKTANGEPDYVLVELEEALKHNKFIAPICIQGATMPTMPAALKPIEKINAQFVSEGRHLIGDVNRMMNGFEVELERRGASRLVSNPNSEQQIQDTQTHDYNADLGGMLRRFTEAVKANDVPQALIWIAQLRSSGQPIPAGYKLDQREKELQARLREKDDRQRRRDVADFQYQFVRSMIELDDPAEEIRAAVEAIWTIEPGYIPDDLANYIGQMQITKPAINESANEEDELYDEALELVRKVGLPSAQLLQRQLKISTQRALRLIDMMKKRGDISLVASPKTREHKRSTVAPSFSLPLLEWINIPAGSVTLGETGIYKVGTYRVEPFAISKYPVTDAQFQAFIEDGYHHDRWWQGLAERFEKPEMGYSPIDNYPRESVNWYEAVAFCRWLSDKLGREILLPTEMQWQRAAQGDDGREYPWGKSFSKTKCNTSESGIGQSTPVDRYPLGASPYGVMDMSGNVWEWCLSEYDHPGTIDIGGDAARVVRGGSWSTTRNNVHVTYRSNFNPDIRGSNLGFRLVTSL